MHGVFFFIVNQPFTIFFPRFLKWSFPGVLVIFLLSLVFSSVKASDGLFIGDKLEDSRFSLEKPNLNRDMLLDACIWEIDLTFYAEKWHYVTKYLRSRSSITNDTMLCAHGRHAPQQEFSLFSETAQLGWVEEDESEKWRVEMVSVYNWLGLLYCWMKSLLLAGTFSPVTVLKSTCPKGKWWERFQLSDRKSTCPGQSDGWEFRALHTDIL